MVAAVVIAGAAVAFVVISGGDDDLDLTQAQLERALLTPEDLGPDFEDTTDASDDEDDPGFKPSAECKQLIDEFENTDDTGDDAQVELTKGDSELELTHSVEPLEENDPELDDLRSLVERCPTVPFDDGEATGEIRFTAEDGPEVGDEALALKIELSIEEPEAVDLQAYAVYFFRGGIVTSVSALGGLDDSFSPLPVDEGFVRDTAKKADEKLQRVADED